MVDIAPFCALRYALGSPSRALSDVIAPPYDVINADQRAALVRRSDKNIVQLELPAGDGVEKYPAAAALLAQWRDEGVLQQDRRASFYVLESSFRIEDPFAPKKKLTRYGVLAALRLETPGRGAVHPHERTLPKAKEDRLNLIRSVRTNVSPIFGLFFDRKREWRNWIAAAVRQKPLAVGRENDRLSHRMWKVDRPDLQRRLKLLLKAKDLYIADGHHRYEVACAYQEERLHGEPSADLVAGWRRVMTYICPMEEAGLLMLPTHRLVRSDKTHEEWRDHIEKFFHVSKEASLDKLVRRLASKKPTERVLGWMSSQGMFALTFKETPATMALLSPRAPALRALDVVLLHDLVFGESDGLAFLEKKELEYTRDIAAMKSRVRENPEIHGFLLGSAGVEALAHVAESGEVMPPKTTYFYPKVPTGFTMMPVNQKIA